MNESQAVITSPRQGIDLRPLVANVAVAALYIASAKLGFSLAFATKQVTAVWPPTGIAVAALLLLGYRVWPGIWLGAFVSNAFSHEPLLAAAGIATGNTLAPLLGVFLMRRFLGFQNSLERLRDVVGLVLLGSAGAMTVSATNGVLNLAAAKIIPWSQFGPVWWLWWTGDAMGVLLIAPLILTWASPKRRVEANKRSGFELAGLVAALALSTALLFLTRSPFAYPVYPFIIWTALRFGQRTTTLALAAISGVAIWGTTHGFGPFTTGSPDHRLILLVTFMAVLALTGLVLGAVTAERQLAGQQLEAAERRFQVLAESVPQMVWTADASGWIDWYNPRWYEYTGQTPAEAAGWGWQRAHHQEDFPRVMQDWPRSIATGESFNIESRIRYKDGTFRWFLMRAEPLRDSSGAIVRWYGTNTDIDDQQRTLQQTVRVAETLQAAFLPDRLPARPDLRFDALYITAEREALIGGDWYDAFELPDGSIVISIGDVMGHGVRAAVTAGRIRHGIFAMAFDVTDPATILVKLNRTLQFQVQDDVLTTALVAILDPQLTSMRYASAGHPPPVMAGTAFSAQFLPYGGPPLGTVPALDLQTHRVELQPDAVILFYTDGITESKRDIDGAETVLRNAVTRLVGNSAITRPAAVLQRAVMGSAKPKDDAVLMVVQLGLTTAIEPVEPTDLRKTWTFHSSDAYSAHASRHELMTFVRRFVSAGDELFRVELVIGELLANTVEHAPGIVNVEIDWRGTHPVMTIFDTGPGLLRFSPRLPEDSFTEDGRGLYLIRTLAKDVQVESAPDLGTKMTVTLSVARDGAYSSPSTSSRRAQPLERD